MKSNPRAEAGPASPTLIDVAIEEGRWTDKDKDRVRTAVAAALARSGDTSSDTGAEVSVLLTDDASIRKLNKSYRHKDNATNVLSFPGADVPAASGRLLGDIVLAHETIAREAVAQGKTFGAHLSHLVVHGVLHLLGFDHQTAREAAVMEAHERETLAALGIADPYGPADGAETACIETTS